jgi:pentatricopeptide repeat domain-containing protein 1
MRLSRRNRYGAVPPTNVTYALAINVCQRTEFDLDTIETFLRWAQDDGVQPTVYMYASAIWAAQRAGDCAKALEYFNEMQSLGCRPNSVAYDGVISALCDYGETDHVLSVYGRTRSAGFEVSPPTMKVRTR